MPHRLIRLINIDVTMIILNATSVTTLVLSYINEHLSGFGGFILMLSIAALNFSKAYANYRNANKNKRDDKN